MMKPKIIDFLKDKKILVALWASGSKTDKTTYQRFYLPLKDVCSKIVLFGPRDNYLLYGKRGMNKRFLDLVEKEKFDMIFMEPMHTEFYPKTLIKIREISNAKVIGMFSDDSWRFEEYTKYYAPFFDVIISVLCKSALKKYEREGIKNVVMSYGGLNPEFFKPINLKKKYDVAFIGNAGKERAELISYLHVHGIKVDVWGRGWERYKGIEGHGYISPDKLVETVNQCKINLNFSFAGNNTVQIKGRPFEFGACKAFILSQQFQDYRDYFNEDELVMFKDAEDMINKIKHYLVNDKEREEIAERMYNRIINEYSLDSELDIIFTKIMGCWDEKWKIPNIRKMPFKLDYTNLRFMLAGILRSGKWMSQK